VHRTRAGNRPLPLAPGCLAARLLALLLLDPRRSGFTSLGDEPPGGRASGGQREHADGGLLPLAAPRLLAALPAAKRRWGAEAREAAARMTIAASRRI
jgi:hypothetical protein